MWKPHCLLHFTICGGIHECILTFEALELTVYSQLTITYQTEWTK